MSKPQKLSFIYFEDLPDEILLNMFSFLDIKGVLQCGQVSKRLRAISNDQCLWSKLNLHGQEVPYGIIEKAIQNGCEYLNLGYSCVYGGKKSKVPWNLKYLKLTTQQVAPVPKGVLKNCHFLQKLALHVFRLDSNAIEQICQNGETLQILSLEGCNIDFCQRTELVKKLFTKCPQLIELNISKGIGGISSNRILLDHHVCALVENLTPDILKLNLASQEVTDELVHTLVSRCNKITELDLSFTRITNDSVESIKKHLNCIEKLNLYYTKIDFSSLLQLKSIPTLKSLHFGRSFGSKEYTETTENMKLQLPHISINEDEFYIKIATPSKYMNRSVDQDWLWEIKAKIQVLFRETC